VSHPLNVPCHGSPVARLLMPLATWLHPSYTSFDRFLVHIQTGTVKKNVLHDGLPSSYAEGHQERKQSALRALAQARRLFGVRNDVQARLMGGLPAPRLYGLHPAQDASII